jgi:hypothetical protein
MVNILKILGLKSRTAKKPPSKPIKAKRSPIQYPKWLDEGLSSSSKNSSKSSNLKWLDEGLSSSSKNSSKSSSRSKKNSKTLKKKGNLPTLKSKKMLKNKSSKSY